MNPWISEALKTAVCFFGMGAAAVSVGCAKPSAPVGEEKKSMGQSVVQVRTNAGRGTGFVVKRPDNERLVIVTAADIIADTTAIDILHEEILDATVYRTAFPDVKVAAIDFERDIAVLEIPNLPKGALYPLELDANRCGAVRSGWGYPETDLGSVTEVGLAMKDISPQQEIKLSAEESFGPERRELSKDKVKGVVFSPHLGKGNLGGPLLSEDKKVVAMMALRSGSEDQGAGVCASEIQSVLAAIKTPTVTRETVKALLAQVFEIYLPNADKADSAYALRDFVPASAIVDARGVMRGVFLNEMFVSQSFEAASAIFEQAFQGVQKQAADVASRCQKKAGLEALLCRSDLHTRPIALSLLRNQVRGEGGVRDVRDIEVVDEPKLVSSHPPEYVVNAKWVGTDGNKTTPRPFRIREEWGRLWVVPPEVRTVWEEARKQWDEKGEKFVGRWEYKDPPCKGDYEIAIRRKDEGFAASAKITGQFADECFLSYSAEYQVDRERDQNLRHDRLRLKLLPETIRAEPRCTWNDDVTLTLELGSEGRLHCTEVEGDRKYKFCSTPGLPIFTRVATP